jgi:hypothetical protein
MTISGLELAFITKHTSWDCLSVSLHKENKRIRSDYHLKNEFLLEIFVKTEEEEENSFL